MPRARFRSLTRAIDAPQALGEASGSTLVRSITALRVSVARRQRRVGSRRPPRVSSGRPEPVRNATTEVVQAADYCRLRAARLRTSSRRVHTRRRRSSHSRSWCRSLSHDPHDGSAPVVWPSRFVWRRACGPRESAFARRSSCFHDALDAIETAKLDGGPASWTAGPPPRDRHAPRPTAERMPRERRAPTSSTT